MTMMRTGRHTKLTPDVEAHICAAVRVGLPLGSAARMAGIGPATLFDWLQRGQGTHPTRAPRSVYVEFAEAVEKAKAEDEARRLARIEQAGRGGAVLYDKTITYPDGRVQREVRYSEPQWTADAWYLERSRPEQWARRDRLQMQLSVERAATMVAQELGLNVAEVLEEARALLRKVDERGT